MSQTVHHDRRNGVLLRSISMGHGSSTRKLGGMGRRNAKLLVARDGRELFRKGSDRFSAGPEDTFTKDDQNQKRLQKGARSRRHFLDNLSSIVTDIRHTTRKGHQPHRSRRPERILPEGDIAAIAEHLPQSLVKQVRRVYTMHRSLSDGNFNGENLRLANAKTVPRDDFADMNLPSGRPHFHLPQISSLNGCATDSLFGSTVAPPVFERLLDRENYTGIYRQRFKDFESARDRSRKSFSRMIRNRKFARLGERDPKELWKNALRTQVGPSKV